jgi:hypothetical protein
MEKDPGTMGPRAGLSFVLLRNMGNKRWNPTFYDVLVEPISAEIKNNPR